MKMRKLFAVSALSVAVLTACGGDGDGGGTPSNTKSVQGVLLAPEQIAASSARIVAAGDDRHRARIAATPPTCPDVPAGYFPLAGVSIVFKDKDGKQVDTVATDACGKFSRNVPLEAVQAEASATSFKPVAVAVDRLSGTQAPTLLSTVPAGANYVISVLQYLGTGSLAFTITDDKTGKAVLGLGQNAFGVAINQTPAALTDVSYGASAAKSASVSLVMDASGSMTTPADTVNGKNRLQLASLAAHALLDGLTSGSDQAGMVVFDNRVDRLDDATIAARLPMAKKSDSLPVAYTLGADGLSSEVDKLHLLADAYNRSSVLWGRADVLHAKSSTEIKLTGFYPWGGTTAFYAGTQNGLEQLARAKNARKLVVALTDGIDNASGKHTKDTVIASARAAGVPIYTVAFGGEKDVDQTSMEAVASATGGEYKRVTSTDVTGLFQSIQTGIRFQYTGVLSAVPKTGDTVEFSATINGEKVSRVLTIN